MPMLSKEDLANLEYAKKSYGESKGRAIHISINHVENLLRIIEKLRCAPLTEVEHG